MKKLLLLTTLLLWSVGSYAEAIDEETAHAVAQKFFEQKTLRLASTTHGAATLKLAAQNSAYYVYNRGANAGYVVVAADDAALPVLGYADSGHFVADSLPENLRWWLSEYEREIAAAAKLQTAVPSASTMPTASATASTTATTTERAAIAPLLTSKWGQSAPYNLQCPLQGGKRCFAGCTATAVAQIMYYHKWPTVGQGSTSYAWKIKGVVQDTLSADFSQSTYDWAQMTDTYDDSSSEASKAAVAKLMSDVGISMKMEYSTTASGAYAYYALLGLLNYFDYDKSGIIYHRYFYSRSTWEQMCYDELAAKRPFFYTGYTEGDSGHSFVCDGYRDGYFHINWGWEGMSDGYFRLSALDPSQQGVGGSNSGYNFSQCVLFNLQPAQEGSDYVRYMACNSEFWPKAGKYLSDETETFGAIFVNGSLANASGYVGVKVTNTDGESVYIQGDKSYTDLPYGKTVVDFSIKKKDFPTAKGLYYIRPAYFDNYDQQWHDALTLCSEVNNYAVAVVSDTLIFGFASDLDVLKVDSLAVNCQAYAGKTLRATATFRATRDSYYGRAYLLASDANFSGKTSRSSPALLDIEPGESQTLEFTMTVPDTVCDVYYLTPVLEDETFFDMISFSIKSAPTDTASLALAGKLNVDNVRSVVADDFHLSTSITCKAGYYDDYLYLIIWPYDGDNYVSYFYVANFPIGVGETRTVDFRGALTGVEAGKSYYATLYRNRGDGNMELMYGDNNYYAVPFTVGSLTPVETVTAADAQPHAIHIYNAAGVLVDSQRAATADLSRLAPGLYIVREGSAVRKVIKR